jgi:hypothetical protein
MTWQSDLEILKHGAMSLGIGWVIALGLGTLVIFFFYRWQAGRLHKALKTPAEERHRARVSPTLTGLIERAIFTVVMFAQPDDALTAMGAWMALKMAANWQREGTPADPQRRNSLAVLALLCGLLSMAFAALGGVAASAFFSAR